jgi:hypothetical protein
LARLQVIPFGPLIPGVDENERLRRNPRIPGSARLRDLPVYDFAQPPLITFRARVYKEDRTSFSPWAVVPAGADARYARIWWGWFSQRVRDEIFIVVDKIVSEHCFARSELVTMPPLPANNPVAP